MVDLNGSPSGACSFDTPVKVVMGIYSNTVGCFDNWRIYIKYR